MSIFRVIRPAFHGHPTTLEALSRAATRCTTGALPSLVMGRLSTAMLRAEPAFPTQALPVHLLDGPTADLQELGQFPLAHSLRPFHPDVLPLPLSQAGASARETAFDPRLRLAATERSLIEFRHYSLKASTIASWSLPLAVAVSKSSDRDRNSTPARCRLSITCSPQVSPVSGGAKVDRVGGRSLTAIIWLLNPAKPAPAVTPEQ